MLSRGEDDYTRELEYDHGKALWRAELSNGEVIVQDDGRPGLDEPSAWKRLAQHLSLANLRIVRMWVQFRSNIQNGFLPDNAEGYFFSHQSVGLVGAAPVTAQFMLLGACQSGTSMVIYRWKVPELILLDVEERDPQKAGPCLIVNPRA